MPRTHRATAAFVLLAYALSWAWWVPMAVAGTVVEPGQGWPTHLPGLLGPAIAAFVVTACTDGRRGVAELWSRVARWRVGWLWYGIVAATAATALIALLTNSDARAGDYVLYSGAPSMGPAVVAYVLAVNGFGEETGWRGFLADRLLDHASRGRAALVVWPIWGIWHLPLFWVVGNFRDFSIAGTVGWAVAIGFGSVFLTWLYDSARRSILIVALWHAAYNFTTATDATSGATAVVTSAAVVAAAVVILRQPSTWLAVRERPRTTRG